MQKRVEVIATCLATLFTAITAEICQVSNNCVTKYVEQFQQKATLSQIVSNNMPPRKIVWWMEAYLELSSCEILFVNYKRYSQTISSLVHTRFPRKRQ